MAELFLGEDLPRADEAAWQALVDEALKGAPFASLRSNTYDGIVIEPLYARASEASLIAGRAAGVPWTVMQRIDLPDAESRQHANPRRSEQRRRPASRSSSRARSAITATRCRRPTPRSAQALDDVYLDAGIAVELDLGRPSKARGGTARHAGQGAGTRPPIREHSLRLQSVRRDRYHRGEPKALAGHRREFRQLVCGYRDPRLHRTLRRCRRAADPCRRRLGGAGACLRARLRRRLSPRAGSAAASLDDARRIIFFRLAADQDQFLTIAKFRAIRKLWARIEEACGLEPRSRLSSPPRPPGA